MPHLDKYWSYFSGQNVTFWFLKCFSFSNILIIYKWFSFLMLFHNSQKHWSLTVATLTVSCDLHLALWKWQLGQLCVLDLFNKMEIIIKYVSNEPWLVNWVAGTLVFIKLKINLWTYTLEIWQLKEDVVKKPHRSAQGHCWILQYYIILYATSLALETLSETRSQRFKPQAIMQLMTTLRVLPCTSLRM